MTVRRSCLLKIWNPWFPISAQIPGILALGAAIFTFIGK